MELFHFLWSAGFVQQLPCVCHSQNFISATGIRLSSSFGSRLFTTSCLPVRNENYYRGHYRRDWKALLHNTVSEKERKRRICFQNNDYSSSFQCDKGRSCHGMTKNFCLRPSETPGKAKLQQVRKERHICLTCWGQHGINWDSWAWGLGMWWEPKATFPGPQCLPKAIPLRNKGLWKKISG